MKVLEVAIVRLGALCHSLDLSPRNCFDDDH